MDIPVRRSTLVVSQLVLTLCVVQTLPAQISTLPRGARIRVSAPGVSPTPLIGVVDSMSDGAIMMQVRRDGYVVKPVIRLSEVTHVDVSRGRKRPTWSKTAPLWLTALAAGTGAIVAHNNPDDDDYFSRGEEAALSAIGMGTLGLLVGTGLAIGVKKERWESVLETGASRASVPPSFYVAPASRRVTLGLRAAF